MNGPWTVWSLAPRTRGRVCDLWIPVANVADLDAAVADIARREAECARLRLPAEFLPLPAGVSPVALEAV